MNIYFTFSTNVSKYAEFTNIKFLFLKINKKTDFYIVLWKHLFKGKK